MICFVQARPLRRIGKRLAVAGDSDLDHAVEEIFANPFRAKGVRGLDRVTCATANLGGLGGHLLPEFKIAAVFQGIGALDGQDMDLGVRLGASGGHRIIDQGGGRCLASGEGEGAQGSKGAKWLHVSFEAEQRFFAKSLAGAEPYVLVRNSAPAET